MSDPDGRTDETVLHWGAFMNITAAHKIITAVPLVAMLVLAGCGGGSERRQIADLQKRWEKRNSPRRPSPRLSPPG